MNLSENSLTDSNNAEDLSAVSLSVILDKRVRLNDLLGTIFSKIHPLFSVDCAVLLIYDNKHSVVKEAFVSTLLSGTDEIECQNISKPTQLTKIQNLIAAFPYPVLKTFEEWQNEEGDNHILVDNSNHYKFHCYIPLEVDNLVIGTLELHNESQELSTESLTFCNNIADLIGEIIFQQTKNPATETSLSQSLLISANSESKVMNKRDQINAKLNRIEQCTELESFFELTFEMFPLAYSKFKIQLDNLRALNQQSEDRTLYVEENTNEPNSYPEIIGVGIGMKTVFALIDRLIGSDSTVLISGETGTGKELIAKAIHSRSDRKEKPVIMINCAAIPANLIESELFGHEKGAFTGATDKRIGKFELAEGGTLFLDEIGEMPLDLQVKLLRALQEKEIERVGGTKVIKTDVRIISATNRNLLTEVQKGRFRQDLFFRLNVFPVKLPPLRERAEDIPLLAEHFLLKYAKKFSKNITGFSKGAIKQMQLYDWPGNIRELEHLIEREILLCKKPIISQVAITVKDKTLKDRDGKGSKVKTIDENERDHIFDVLQLCKGVISGANGAAKLLGVPATTLNSKIKRLGLSKKALLTINQLNFTPAQVKFSYRNKLVNVKVGGKALVK